ncbi:MAG: hypothetical protein EOO67_12450 [Microbacterium sp.]|nr:MAG: hypothetical protein EOO67_12450 [Microbacterium sp.]
MPELSVEADPGIWSAVPAEADAEPWLRALLEGRDEEQSARILLAADLAVAAKEAAGDALVLLLSEPVSGLYASLALLVTDAPALSDAGRVEELALAITPSSWPPTTTRLPAAWSQAGLAGWRVTVLLDDSDRRDDDAEAPDPDAGSPATAVGWVRTTYVLDLHGRLALAQLSPLTPVASTVAMALTEQLLPTIEMTAHE